MDKRSYRVWGQFSSDKTVDLISGTHCTCQKPGHQGIQVPRSAICLKISRLGILVLLIFFIELTARCATELERSQNLSSVHCTSIKLYRVLKTRNREPWLLSGKEEGAIKGYKMWVFWVDFWQKKIMIWTCICQDSDSWILRTRSLGSNHTSSMWFEPALTLQQFKHTDKKSGKRADGDEEVLPPVSPVVGLQHDDGKNEVRDRRLR